MALFKNLAPPIRRRMLAYIDSPTLEEWHSIRWIPISHGQTLFDVIDCIDRDWPGTYPSAILVARASKFVEKRDADLAVLEM